MEILGRVSVNLVISYLLKSHCHKSEIKKLLSNPRSKKVIKNPDIKDEQENMERRLILKKEYIKFYPEIISRKWYDVEVNEQYFMKLNVIRANTWLRATNGSFKLRDVNPQKLCLKNVLERWAKIDKRLIILGDSKLKNTILEGNIRATILMDKLKQYGEFEGCKAFLGFHSPGIPEELG